MSESAGASVYGVMATWLTPSFLFVVINLVIGTIVIASRFANTTKRQQHHQLFRSPSLLDRLTSFNFGHHKHESTTPPNFDVHPVQTSGSPRLDRVPSSSLLDRVKSFSLGLYKTKIEGPNSVEQEEHNPVEPNLDRAPSSSLLNQVTSFNLSFNKEKIEEPNLPNQDLDQVHSLSLLDRVRSFDLGFKKIKNERPNSVEQQLTDSPSILQRLRSLTFERSESVKEVERESKSEEMGEEREEEEGVDAKADDFINRFRQQLRLQRLDSILRYRGSN